jgi:hypothetical protein
MIRLFVAIMMLVIDIVMRMFIGFLRNSRSGGNRLGRGGRCLGRFAMTGRCRDDLRRRLVVMPVAVCAMVVCGMPMIGKPMIVMAMIGVLVRMMIVLIMVAGMRFAEAVRMLGMIVFSVRTLVGVPLEAVTFVIGIVGVRLRIVAFGVRRGRGAFNDLALHALPAAAAARTAMATAAAIRAIFALFVRLAVGTFFGLDQGLTIGDRDLIVIRVNFAESEEAVAVAAILDEGGLQGWLNPRDLREVDITAQLLALGRLEIKFLDAVATNDNNPGLFRVGSIDQHLVGHIGTLGGDGRDWPRARDALSDDATVHLIRG